MKSKQIYEWVLNFLVIAVNLILILNLFNSCQKSCFPVECKNGGVEMECGCLCPEGFTGEDCSQKKCPTPCYNGGTCLDGTCQCPPEWGGPDCSTPVDMCAGVNPCQNGGVCEDGKCKCPPGCSGQFCETCTETETIHPNGLVQLCINHTKGDKDFGGMGVKVYVEGKLRKVNDRELWADLKITLKQSVIDVYHPDTHGHLEKSVKLWAAPNGYKITGWDKSGLTSKSYVDYNTALDEIPFSNSFISKFVVNAETEGDDFGECTFNYSYLDVDFSYLKVTLLPE